MIFQYMYEKKQTVTGNLLLKAVALLKMSLFGASRTTGPANMFNIIR
jgi:hypothetical protein